MKYTIKQFKVGDFETNAGVWCDVVFEEDSSEPIRWVVAKDKVELVRDGATIDGEIVHAQSKAGKSYRRFYTDHQMQEKKERAAKFGGGFSSGSNQRGGTKREDQPRDDAAIQAQWAIGQANAQATNGLIEPDEVEEKAKDFFDMIERVKNHDKPEEDKHLTDEQKQVVAAVPDADKMVELSEIPF